MQNPNEKMTYELQEAQIAEKSQAFINLLSKRGLLANPKVTNEKIRAARQKKDRDSYHNTLLLLQNYRTLVWVMGCFPETVAEELDRPFSDVDELLEQMDLQLAMGQPQAGESAGGCQEVPAAAGQSQRRFDRARAQAKQRKETVPAYLHDLHSPRAAQSYRTALSVGYVFPALLPPSTAGHYRSFSSIVVCSFSGGWLLAGYAFVSGRTVLNLANTAGLGYNIAR